MAQAYRAVVKRTLFIRSPMLKRPGHPVKKGAIHRLSGIEIYDAADSTHERSPSGHNSAMPSSLQRSRTDSCAARLWSKGRPESAKYDALMAKSSFAPLAWERTQKNSPRIS